MGRDELVKYLQKHPHQVGAWTQDTVNKLELDLDYFTDVLSTNTGGIFELHIGDHTTLVVLRPSLGSTAFLAFRKHGPHAAALILRSVHNQMRLVGRCG